MTDMADAAHPALLPRRHHDAVGGSVLSLLLLCAVALFACWLVGTRSIDVGTDTSTYAGFFDSLGAGEIETRLEPGFLYLSLALRKLGLDLAGYQTVLFGLLLAAFAAAAQRYFRYLGFAHGYLVYLSAALMFLLISPMFVNASINTIRQGLAAPLVFAALLAFHRRRWAEFAAFGALACSFHLSSALYLAFAPTLLLSPRMQRAAAALAFLAYVSGASMALVRAAVPSLYDLVMEYTASSYYRSGVRVDFAVFSIFWYALPHVLAPMVRQEFRQRIKDSTAIYLVMMLPFFAVGWGFFSNRYLLPAWLAASLILAAILFQNRLAVLRQPLLIGFGLIASCGVFYYFVTHGIVI